MFKTFKQKGFTMIELVIVIVILGILAAMILPRFADLQTRARKASQKGLFSSLIAAYEIAHAEWLAAGDSSATTILLENQTVTMGASGFPTADNAGIISATTNITGYNTNFGTNSVVFEAESGGANCGVIYTYDGSGAPSVTFPGGNQDSCS